MQEEVASVGFADSIGRKYQYVMDKLSPMVTLRWVVFVVAFALYFVRVYYLNGWFIVTYALGIYLLNQLIGFLSPQVKQSSLFILSRSVTTQYYYLSSTHALYHAASLTPKKVISMRRCPPEITRNSGIYI